MYVSFVELVFVNPALTTILPDKPDCVYVWEKSDNAESLAVSPLAALAVKVGMSNMIKNKPITNLNIRFVMRKHLPYFRFAGTRQYDSTCKPPPLRSFYSVIPFDSTI